MMKELHTGQLYWPTTIQQAASYGALNGNTSATIAVLGGGMSGVACAYTFAEAGLDTVLIERGTIAAGSTSANTGLLQFSSDMMLSELQDQIGKEPARRFYRSSLQALEHIAELAKRLKTDVEFRPRSSLYYASSEQELPGLKLEYEALRDCGFDVEWWDADKLEQEFPFRKPGAIVTHGDAEINPLKFAVALSEEAAALGLRIFEDTDMVNHERLEGNKHRLHTASGHTIDVDYVVYAIGYEPEELRGRLRQADLNRSYVIVTDPQEEGELWQNRMMIWETARPYLYMRATCDNRIIVGGLDEEKERPVHNRKHQADRSEELLSSFKALFPDSKARIEFTWNATFGESLDGLPFVGEDPSWPGVYYNLGYGGNGTVCSVLGSQILLDMIKNGAPHPLPFIGIRDFAERR
ncbi:FAD-dependent oxidoreductase [Paenibacillus sp. PL2-23]|uniref:NAD(P)/FAD-dependent oxidoreductase n=1 Tax=Paenibacillus sp. PL2-23 TaxID=2100729 RepID=UPI0030F81BA1